MSGHMHLSTLHNFLFYSSVAPLVRLRPVLAEKLHMARSCTHSPFEGWLAYLRTLHNFLSAGAKRYGLVMGEAR